MTEGEPLRSVPEPPLGDLYSLYTQFQRKARVKFMSEQSGDVYKEEQIAMMFRSKSLDEYRELLDSLAPDIRAQHVKAVVSGFEAYDGEEPARMASPEGREVHKKNLELIMEFVKKEMKKSF